MSDAMHNNTSSSLTMPIAVCSESCVLGTAQAKACGSAQYASAHSYWNWYKSNNSVVSMSFGCHQHVQQRAWHIPVWLCLTYVALGFAQATLAQPDSERTFEPRSDIEFKLPLAEKNAQEADQAIEQLGSPDFAVREQGSQLLSSIGAPALRKLRDAYRLADDLEVRLRIERIVRKAYINFHVFSRNGFLGVERNRRSFLTQVDDQRIKPGFCGIKITKVSDNTGAARAGLEAGDIVVAINGVPFPVNANPSATFGESIRRNPPGTTIKLTILRGEHTNELDATLGTCPPGDVRPGRMDAVARDLANAETQYGSWWIRNFVE